MRSQFSAAVGRGRSWTVWACSVTLLLLALSGVSARGDELPEFASPVTITVVNRSSLASDDEVSRYTAAIQKQIASDFAPVWGRTARVVFTTGEPEADSWVLQVLDDPDRPMSFGYHDAGDSGVPYMKVFVRLCQMLSVPVSRVMSHEIMETLGNPRIENVVVVDNADGSAMAARIEVCDPVLSSTYQIDSVTVSDFVTPAYFFRRPAGPYDFLKVLSAPLTIARDGTQIYRQLTQISDWTSLF
jgi:hypothetical protein